MQTEFVSKYHVILTIIPSLLVLIVSSVSLQNVWALPPPRDDVLKTEIPVTAAPLNASAGSNATQQVQQLGSASSNSGNGSSGNNSEDDTPQQQEGPHNNPNQTPAPNAEDCFDGVDNDGDGLVDTEDKDCSK